MKKMISILTIVAVAMTAAFAAPQAGDVSLNINGVVSSKIAHKFTASSNVNPGNFASAEVLESKTLDMTSTLEQEVGYYNLYTNHTGDITVKATISQLSNAGSTSHINFTINGTKVAAKDTEIAHFLDVATSASNEARVLQSKIVLALDSDSLVRAKSEAYSTDLKISVTAN